MCLQYVCWMPDKTSRFSAIISSSYHSDVWLHSSDQQEAEYKEQGQLS